MRIMNAFLSSRFACGAGEVVDGRVVHDPRDGWMYYTHFLIESDHELADYNDMPKIIKACGLLHVGSSKVDFTNCPVAGNWTLLNSHAKESP